MDVSILKFSKNIFYYDLILLYVFNYIEINIKKYYTQKKNVSNENLDCKLPYQLFVRMIWTNEILNFIIFDKFSIFIVKYINFEFW